MQIFAPLRSSAVGLRAQRRRSPPPRSCRANAGRRVRGPARCRARRTHRRAKKRRRATAAPPGDGCAAGRRLRRLVASQIRRARGGGELIVIVTGRRATVVLRRGLRPAVIRQRDAQRRKEVRASRQLVELCVVESHPVGATVALELVDRDGTLRRARYERPELAHEHSRGHRARHSSPPARLLEVRRPDERLLLGEGRRVNLGGRRAFVHQPRVVEGLWWTYRIGLRA